MDGLVVVVVAVVLGASGSGSVVVLGVDRLGQLAECGGVEAQLVEVGCHEGGVEKENALVLCRV